MEAEVEDLRLKNQNLTEKIGLLRKEIEDLKKAIDQKVNFTKFSNEELMEAISKFNPKVKLGDGGYGDVYKGELRRTYVAIKLLKDEAIAGEKQFRQEVDVLSRVRHPNLVTLVGACPERGALVYEYLAGGTLDDRLACRFNKSALSWQDRIRIASEICSALVFLHTHKPDTIVHGDLKPTNILFNGHDVSKLSDFGICRILPQSTNGTTAHRTTRLKDRDGYVDPIYYDDGILTIKVDVYAFGVIVLRLLTSNRPAAGLVYEVTKAMEKKRLSSIIDSKWPSKVAEELAELALRCCLLDRRERPDLATEVWEKLERLKSYKSGRFW